MTNIVTKSNIHILHFIVENVRMCIDLQYLNRILPLSYLEPVPHSPKYLAGIMNFRGQSIQIIDLAIRLDLPRKQSYSLDVPILLCSNRKHQIGMIVDKAIRLTTINTDSLQIHEEFNRPESSFLATVPDDDELSLLINMPNIFPGFI